jgi:glutamate racemase
VKAIVIACNTASSLALEELREELSVPVIGTINCAASKAVEVTKSGVIGVIGTEATINSEAYNHAILARDPSVRVHAQPCPLFVPLVEQGMHSGEIVQKVVEHYLAPLKSLKVDTVVLGCTHYPLLTAAIQEYLGGGVEIVECSSTLAEELESCLATSDLISSEKSSGSGMCYVTDELSRFKALSSLLIKGEPLQVVQVHPLDDESGKKQAVSLVK